MCFGHHCDGRKMDEKRTKPYENYRILCFWYDFIFRMSKSDIRSVQFFVPKSWLYHLSLWFSNILSYKYLYRAEEQRARWDNFPSRSGPCCQRLQSARRLASHPLRIAGFLWLLDRISFGWLFAESPSILQCGAKRASLRELCCLNGNGKHLASPLLLCAIISSILWDHTHTLSLNPKLE